MNFPETGSSITSPAEKLTQVTHSRPLSQVTVSKQSAIELTRSGRGHNSRPEPDANYRVLPLAQGNQNCRVCDGGNPSV